MIRSGQAVGRIKEQAGGTQVKYFILAETLACIEEELLTVWACWVLFSRAASASY